MKRTTLIIIVNLFFLALAWSQSGQPLRVEIPVRSGSNPFNYIPFGDKGLCLFYPTINDAGKDSVSWSFVMLDRNLKEQWRKLLPIQEDVNYLQGLSRNGAIYLLFHDTRKNAEENIHVFFIYPDKQIITEHRSAIPEKADIVDFDILNDNALIGYNLRKGTPGILGFSLVNGEKRNFTIDDKDDALLLDIFADTTYKDVYTVYKVQPSSSKNLLKLNQYNSSSALRRTINFSNLQERRILNSAQFVSTAEGKGIISGTYGPGNRSKRNYDYYNDYYNYYYYNSFYRRQMNQDANRDNTPVSDGYFVATVGSTETGNIQYFNFIDFNNAQKYMNDPEALRTKRKSDIKKGNDEKAGDSDKNYSLEYHLISHPVEVDNGSYILLSEAYVPEYHTMTQMVYDYYGRAIPSTYSVFDGYRYTNAFIAAFDSAGNMKWNNGMEMRGILTNYLNRKMNFYSDSSEMLLFYNANHKLGYKAIKGSEIIENTNFTPIAPKRTTDQFMSEYLGTAEHWYGNYFLMSGYVTLRNSTMDESKRNVFYLNKMEFK
ncbi:MAG: hypothetical protein IPH88_12875 [Bacteroidales bacterium]|nr:hypothetical protein [Bacteroidales bacterium]